ncbi:MAG: prohibitin family protein [Holophagales bacterium]|nr:prohibitin family protein [Holophagales bacterium]
MLGIFDVYFARLRSWIERHTLSLTLTVLAILFMAAFLHRNMFIVVLPGEVGVQWSRFFGGTITDKVYDEGLNVILPWNKMYIYNVRYQRHTTTYDVLSEDGLRIAVEVTVRYKVIAPSAGYLHKYVGPDYLETLLVPEVGSFVREQIAAFRPDELYASDRLRAQIDSFETVRENLSVEIPAGEPQPLLLLQDLLLRNIELPPRVASAIESKLTQEQLMLEYDYVLQREEKEKERKRIEAEGIRLFQDIVSEGISDRYLRWKGIDATLEMATSANAKVVVIGAGEDGLPIILGNVDSPPATDSAGGRAPGPPRSASTVPPPQAIDPLLDRGTPPPPPPPGNGGG